MSIVASLSGVAFLRGGRARRGAAGMGMLVGAGETSDFAEFTESPVGRGTDAGVKVRSGRSICVGGACVAGAGSVSGPASEAVAKV